jgi:hypothetical protein
VSGASFSVLEVLDWLPHPKSTFGSKTFLFSVYWDSHERCAVYGRGEALRRSNRQKSDLWVKNLSVECQKFVFVPADKLGQGRSERVDEARPSKPIFRVSDDPFRQRAFEQITPIHRAGLVV